jgi:hypothetical protein
MESIGGRRPHWGRRALGLALVGAVVGGIVASVGLSMMMEGLHGLAAPGGPSQSDVALIGLVGGAPCGATLGLVIWSVWFLVSRLARGHRSRPSDVKGPLPRRRPA